MGVRDEWTYTYDYEDPTAYLSDNNRLMEYTTSECTSGQTMMMGGGGAECTVISETYYYYNSHGNVKQVVTKDLYPDPREKQYTATRLGYAKNGQAVTFAAGEEWNDENDYNILWGREFRYDGARQRYLNRVLDPADLMLEPAVFTALTDTWSDYDGNEVYADFTVNGGTATTTRWYELGLGRTEDPFGTPVTKHYHSDMIGTTRFMTERVTGDVSGEAVYTAFGELRPGSTNHRYGYAGAWGYQTDITPGSSPPTSDMPFLHVGHRYYDPATGRFLQRDPIGIAGGLNLYVYLDNSPTCDVDPAGLGPKWDKIKEIANRVKDAIKEAAKYIAPSPGGELAGVLDCGPGIARLKMNDAKREHILKDHEDSLPDPDCEECDRLDDIVNPPKKDPPSPPDPPGGGPSG